MFLLLCIYVMTYKLITTKIRMTYIKHPQRRLNYVSWHLHFILFQPIATVRMDKITHHQYTLYHQHTDATPRTQEMTFTILYSVDIASLATTGHLATTDYLWPLGMIIGILYSWITYYHISKSCKFWGSFRTMVYSVSCFINLVVDDSGL